MNVVSQQPNLANLPPFELPEGRLNMQAIW